MIVARGGWLLTVRRRASRLTWQVVLAFSLLTLIGAVAIAAPRFFSLANALNVADQASIIAIVAAGMTLLMIGGGFDLSVGSVLALGAYVFAALVQAGVWTPLAVGGALVAGATVGMINGYLIAYRGVPGIIMTLAMLYMVRGGLLFVSKGDAIGMTTAPEARFLGTGTIGPLPVPIVVTSLIYLLAYVTMTRLRFGRYTVAVGTDEIASRRAGISVERHRLTLYCLTAALAALAGVVLASKLNAATTTLGTGAELTVIAAVIIGGTSIFGGSGSVFGTLLGVIFLAVVNNSLNLLNVSPFLQQFFVGLLLLVSVLGVSFKNR